MKIIINTAHQRFGGAIQGVFSFIQECKNFPDNEYVVWLGPALQKLVDTSNFPSNFKFSLFDFGVISISKSITIQKVLSRAEKEENPDVIISTTGPSYFKSKSPQVMGYNLGLYIYPESPYFKLISPYRYLRFSIKKIVHFYFFSRDASAYVVQTDDVNKRVRKALKSNTVYTVTNNHSSLFHNWTKYPPKLPQKRKGSLRCVSISAYYVHKNLEIIPEVLKCLDERGFGNVEFILTLKDEDFNKINQKHEPRIINVGTVSPPECPSLYDECDIMFLPTLAECFSASYPEAMIMEKPIVTSNLGFARSICGNAALYFEPMNPISAANKIIELIQSEEVKSKLVLQGKLELLKFDSPKERARKYLEICEFTYKNNQRNGRH